MKLVENLYICKLGSDLQFCSFFDSQKKLKILQEWVQTFHEIQS